MRVVAILAAYNEERFIQGCLEHLFGQGVEVYLIDNESTDATAAIARGYLGRGLVGIETLERDGIFSLRRQLRRKEQLYASLDADWFMHVDADEVHVAPDGVTLAEAFARSERDGFNAVNFLECTFIPTREAPDHDHPAYRDTLVSYYPFLPPFPHLFTAWKRTDVPLDLASSGGHRVRFDGLRADPRPLFMRHYLFLSRDHAFRKYQTKRFDPAEAADGWHGWRTRADFRTLRLPGRSDLRESRGLADLDHSSPWQRHWIEQQNGATRR